jgi:peptidoglycan/LPS O-acetylase OafA/YrhL
MNEKQLRSIDGFPSIILDVIRLVSALVVFFWHLRFIWFPNVPTISVDIGHGAVIVFFVLSGYVIFYTTLNKNRGFLQYFKARLSRLYSVLIPGLLLTVICEFIVRQVNIDIYSEYSRGHSIIRYLLTGTFLNEIFLFSSAPPMNGPLWSLGYEFMFYVIFGFWFYKCKTWKSKSLLVIVSVILLPKIMLLMPIWLIGGYAYRYLSLKINPLFQYILVVLTLLIGCILFYKIPPIPARMGSFPLFFSSQFLTDYLLGLTIAIAFFLLPNGNPISSPNKILLFRKLGDMTYPIYILHQPLLILYITIFGYPPSYEQIVLPCFVILGICTVVGYASNKMKPLWALLFCQILIKIKEINIIRK